MTIPWEAILVMAKVHKLYLEAEWSESIVAVLCANGSTLTLRVNAGFEFHWRMISDA